MTVGTKAQVYKGTADKTSGGLTKKDIIRVKVGTTPTGRPAYRYKSKAKSKKAKKNSWILAVQKAKRELGYPKNSFVLARKSGGTKEERDLYKLAKEIHEEMV